jgi:hypothetical protein
LSFRFVEKLDVEDVSKLLEELLNIIFIGLERKSLDADFEFSFLISLVDHSSLGLLWVGFHRLGLFFLFLFFVGFYDCFRLGNRFSERRFSFRGNSFLKG